MQVQVHWRVQVQLRALTSAAPAPAPALEPDRDGFIERVSAGGERNCWEMLKGGSKEKS